MAEALHGVGEGTALKSLLEILLSTGCVSVQELKGEEAMKGHGFSSPPPIGAAEAGGLSHKNGTLTAKFTLRSHWQTAPCSSRSASCVLSPPVPSIGELHPIHPGTVLCPPHDRPQAHSQQPPRAQFPSHSCIHRDGMTSLCSGPFLEHDGFRCVSAQCQNKTHHHQGHCPMALCNTSRACSEMSMNS